jgi:hypothetical protein
VGHFREAVRDLLFLRDLEETTEAVEAADAETARMIAGGDEEEEDEG